MVDPMVKNGDLLKKQTLNNVQKKLKLMEATLIETLLETVKMHQTLEELGIKKRKRDINDFINEKSKKFKEDSTKSSVQENTNSKTNNDTDKRNQNVSKNSKPSNNFINDKTKNFKEDSAISSVQEDTNSRNNNDNNKKNKNVSKNSKTHKTLLTKIFKKNAPQSKTKNVSMEIRKNSSLTEKLEGTSDTILDSMDFLLSKKSEIPTTQKSTKSINKSPIHSTPIRKSPMNSAHNSLKTNNEFQKSKECINNNKLNLINILQLSPVSKNTSTIPGPLIENNEATLKNNGTNPTMRRSSRWSCPPKTMVNTSCVIYSSKSAYEKENSNQSKIKKGNQSKKEKANQSKINKVKKSIIAKRNSRQSLPSVLASKSTISKRFLFSPSVWRQSQEYKELAEEISKS